MKQSPSNALIYVVVGVTMVIAFYVLGLILVQAREDTNQLPKRLRRSETTLSKIAFSSL